jgi:hypothetical protein
MSDPSTTDYTEKEKADKPQGSIIEHFVCLQGQLQSLGAHFSVVQQL